MVSYVYHRNGQFMFGHSAGWHVNPIKGNPWNAEKQAKGKNAAKQSKYAAVASAACCVLLMLQHSTYAAL